MDIKANINGFLILEEQESIDIVDEFYRWAAGITESNFSAQLFRLICKADKVNKFKLSLGFPLEVQLTNNYSQTLGWWEQFEKDYLENRGKKNGKKQDN